MFFIVAFLFACVTFSIILRCNVVFGTKFAQKAASKGAPIAVLFGILAVQILQDAVSSFLRKI